MNGYAQQLYEKLYGNYMLKCKICIDLKDFCPQGTQILNKILKDFERSDPKTT